MTDAELKSAIALRCSKVFPALNIANSFGGSETVEWQIVRTFSLIDIVREVKARKLDLSGLNCVVEGGPVLDSALYKLALAKMGADQRADRPKK